VIVMTYSTLYENLHIRIIKVTKSNFKLNFKMKWNGKQM
jgi:hypothetical protein